MFWGRTLKHSETLNLTKEGKSGMLLHLSHVSLNPASKPGATTVFIHHGEKKFALVTLEKDKRDFQTLDLYFTTSANTSFSLAGPGEVNLLGYFEPSDENRGDEESEAESEEEPVQLPEGADLEDSEEESESEEGVPALKPRATAQEEDSEEDEESEESSEEEEVKAPAKPKLSPAPPRKEAPAKSPKPLQADPAPQKKPKSAGPESKPKPSGQEGKPKQVQPGQPKKPKI